MEYCFANCVLDTAAHSLTRDGRAMQVEPMVFDLLQLLVRNAGQLVARDKMIDEIWQGRIVSDSAITACVAATRKAVGDDGKAQAVIRTVSRRGLMFVADVKADNTARSAVSARKGDFQRIRYTQNRDGRRLAYAVTGAGPKVVYMRPMSMDLEVDWRIPSERAFIDPISDRFTQLRFDHLGAGQSDRSMAEQNFDRQVENAIAVMDAAEFDEFAMFSTSGGVLPAVHLAACYPNRVSRLAIIGGYVDGSGRRGEAEKPDILRSILVEGWDQPDSPFARAFMSSYFPDGPLETVHDMVRMMQSAVSPEIMLAHRDAINAASITDLLAKVRCPTLIVHGRYDGVHPLSEAQKLTAGIQNAELVVLDTANHLPVSGHATWEPFMDTLIDFLSG